MHPKMDRKNVSAATAEAAYSRYLKRDVNVFRQG